MKKLFLYTGISLQLIATAQEAVAPEVEKVKYLADKIHEIDPLVLFLGIAMASAGFILILAIIVIINAILSIMNAENRRRGIPEISLFGNFKKKFITGDVLPADKSESIALSHSYDGIVELDNTMPPWLRAIFGITIAFAISYLGYYYVLGTGKFQTQEYNEEMEIAAIEMAEYQKKAANSINEENVILEKDPALLAEAKITFAKNCKTCHGANAEGGAGPNLTDEYWLHGGSVKDIFKTIKEGVPAKGMIAWQQKLTPKDIQSMVGYIMSIKGSNPAGAKEPQGELYSESNVPSDTTAATLEADSSVVK